MFNNTLVGNSGARNDAGAIETQVPLALMNNHITGFTEGVRLLSPGATASSLYANVLNNTGSEVECPGLNSDDVNALVSVAGAITCNGTVTPWADNQIAACPLVDAQAADLHLNGALANPCRDAGVTSSPAGVAPTDDIDGQPRFPPFDVGADEL